MRKLAKEKMHQHAEYTAAFAMACESYFAARDAGTGESVEDCCTTAEKKHGFPVGQVLLPKRVEKAVLEASGEGEHFFSPKIRGPKVCV